MSRVHVVGNSCVDIYVPPHEAPPPGGITAIPPIEAQVGGNGANTAVALGRLGVRVALFGLIGDDLFGRFVHETLEREGVDVTRFKLVEGKRSPVTLVQNHANGERSFVHHFGTNAEFSVPDAALRAPCAVFHLAAPELLPGIWPGGAIEMARRAKEAGAVVSLDTFADPNDDRDAIVRDHRAILSTVDMIFPNEEEAVLVSGRRESRSVANYFHQLGVKLVVIKRGEHGAIVSWQGHFEVVPAFPTQSVDTCGAGDNFVAGFLSGYVRGVDPVTCARIGCAMGSLCVAYRGALTGSSEPHRVGRALELAGVEA
ncbi:MAG TPA: sugar kinase [Planctomycetota bacterium]|nr:sugar kinase [Planctomycetota bacterium]